MKFEKLDAKAYRAFEQKNPYGNLYQMAERAELRRKMGWLAELWGVTDDGKIIAGCLVLSKNGTMMVPMGAVLDWSNLKLVDFWLKNMLELAKTTKNMTFEVFPPLKLSIRDVHGEIKTEINQAAIFELFQKYGFSYMGRTTKIENKANRWITSKDLSKFKTVEELRASYKKNVRNKLRKCTPAIEILEVRDDDGLAKVAHAIEGSNEKNGVRSRNLTYYQNIRDAWGDQVHFVLARKKDDKATVAGRVIFDHPNETVSFISGTVQKYRQLNAMTVLQDDLVTKCFEKGIKRVNFYGIEGDFSEHNHLLEFKSGFDVNVEEYIGGFRYVLNPGKYQLAQAKRLAYRVGSKLVRSTRDLAKHMGDRRTKIVRKLDVPE